MLNAQRHAYIFDPAIQQVRRYAVGDTLGNGVVETIGEWTVVLKTPGGRVDCAWTRPNATGQPGSRRRPQPVRADARQRRR